jgi:soluble lytic murein transglycosylase
MLLGDRSPVPDRAGIAVDGVDPDTRGLGVSSAKRPGCLRLASRGFTRLWLMMVVVLLVVLDIVFVHWWRDRRRESSQDRPILAAARHYGVDPALVKAVVWRESAFDPEARGRAGELGLMQVREPAAREWEAAARLVGFAFEHLADPATNTRAGTWYLRKLLARYQSVDNPLPYALADYNAGRTHVLRWMQGIAQTNSEAFLAQMDFPGTRAYVKAVMSRRDHYQDFGRSGAWAQQR